MSSYILRLPLKKCIPPISQIFAVMVMQSVCSVDVAFGTNFSGNY